MNTNRTFFLLFNHNLTEVQENDARNALHVTRFAEPAHDLKTLWSSIPPDLEDIRPYLEPFRAWLETEAVPGDTVLVQGDFGACFHMVNVCFDLGLAPVYSTTERSVSETVMEDGSVSVNHRFNHRMFRYYKRDDGV